MGYDSVFAAVALKDSVGWMARHGHDGQRERSEFVSVAIPGRAEQQYDPAVGIDLRDVRGTHVCRDMGGKCRNIQWSFVTDASFDYYQNYFNAAVMGQERAAYTAVSGDEQYAGYFPQRSGRISRQARHGMSSAGYQATFNQLTAEGYYPICVQGGGSTASPVFAAVFLQQGPLVPRVWTVTGQQVPALTQFDDAMAGFMQTNGVPRDS